MNAIEMLETFGDGGYGEESNDYMIDSLNKELPAAEVKPVVNSEDKRKVQELAFSYYRIKKDQSGWLHHRANVVSQIAAIFKANSSLDGYYNLTNKTCLHYVSEGSSRLLWGQKEQFR